MAYFDSKKTSQFKKANSSYTFIVIPGEVGTSKRFSLSKTSLIVFVLILFVFLGLGTGIFFDYLRLQRVAKDLENLRAENHSIRSEAAAIVSRLQEVQVALNQVDSFSSELKEITTKDPMVGVKETKIKKGRLPQNKVAPKKIETPRPPRGTYQKVDFSDLNVQRYNNKMVATLGAAGIGPIPKEDYQALTLQHNTLSKLNVEQLEFKKTFAQLLELRKRSKIKAQDLEYLLKDVRYYNEKISTTPTLAPVEGGYISSLFGSRTSPISGVNQHHSGIDFAAPLGTTVRAAAQGVVVLVKTYEDYGNLVEIDHGNGIKTRYGHLLKSYVKSGDKVVKGAAIAEVGNTGRSTGPHLHYEVEVKNRKVDPSRYIHIF